MHAKMQRSEMAKCLTVFFSSWPHIVITEIMVELWLQAFPDVDKDEFFRAGVAALKIGNNGYAITIDKVNEMVIKFRTPASEEMSEGESWHIVRTAVSRFGLYDYKAAEHYVKLLNERVWLVCEQIGWRELCMMKTDDAGIYRAHFWKIYTALEKRDRTADLLGLPRAEPSKLELAYSAVRKKSDEARRTGWDTPWTEDHKKTLLAIERGEFVNMKDVRALSDEVPS